MLILNFLIFLLSRLLLGDKKSIENQGNVLISRKWLPLFLGVNIRSGKQFQLLTDKNREYTYTVGAVFADLPENSSFRIDILTHFDNFLLMWEVKDSDWKFWTTALFIQIPDKSMLPSINQSLKQYLPVQNKAREDFKINRYSLVPLDDVGENSRTIWSSGLFPSLHPAALIAPPIMAIFILLIACFNFANTSISTFSKRLKGDRFKKNIWRTEGDSLLLSLCLKLLLSVFLALIVGIIIAEFLVPAYSSLWAYMSIELTFTKYGFLLDISYSASSCYRISCRCLSCNVCKFIQPCKCSERCFSFQRFRKTLICASCPAVFNFGYGTCYGNSICKEC